MTDDPITRRSHQRTLADKKRKLGIPDYAPLNWHELQPEEQEVYRQKKRAQNRAFYHVTRQRNIENGWPFSWPKPRGWDGWDEEKRQSFVEKKKAANHAFEVKRYPNRRDKTLADQKVRATANKASGLPLRAPKDYASWTKVEQLDWDISHHRSGATYRARLKQRKIELGIPLLAPLDFREWPEEEQQSWKKEKKLQQTRRYASRDHRASRLRTKKKKQDQESACMFFQMLEAAHQISKIDVSKLE